jgi:hypothetical protein
MADQEYDNMSMEERAEFDNKAKQREQEEQASKFTMRLEIVVRVRPELGPFYSSTLQMDSGSHFYLCYGSST